MSSSAIVHVVGTGTIGEPLIGLLCMLQDQLGIRELTFHKRTPRLDDRSKVLSLMKKGAYGSRVCKASCMARTLLPYRLRPPDERQSRSRHTLEESSCQDYLCSP